MSRPTLHLVPEAVWDAHDPSAPYLPSAYAEDGFVHCTDGDVLMVEVANRFYRDDPRPFLLLTLDLERTGSPWRFDDDGRRYPHVYGPIEPDIGARGATDDSRSRRHIPGHRRALTQRDRSAASQGRVAASRGGVRGMSQNATSAPSAVAPTATASAASMLIPTSTPPMAAPNG